MSHKKNTKILFLLITALGVFILYLVTSLNQFRSHSLVEGESTIVSDDITVSATIGTTAKMIVEGYAPSSSKVILTGEGIFEERSAEVSGWFSFDNIHKTGSTDEYPELCLIAYLGNLSTQPTCLPSLPGGNNSYNIGPVILSPIISIEQNVFLLGTQVALNGTTIPNTPVNIYFAENSSTLALVQKALAYSIPAYQVESDSKGDFQLNLPSNTIAKWKVYAATTYLDSSSPKSNTLNFTVQNNISYYLKRVYETIVKTTTIVTSVVTAKTDEEVSQKNAERLTNIPVEKINILRSKMPYFVMVLEGLILVLLIVFIVIRKKKKRKKKDVNQK